MKMPVSLRYHRHAMLSITALHIAYLRPEQSDLYCLMAERHQFVALPLIRAALEKVDEENCHALYACSHLIVKYAFASPPPPRSLVFSSSQGTVAEFVPLLRGAFSLHDHSLQWLTAGPLKSALEVPVRTKPSYTHNPDDHRLAALLPLFSRSDDDSAACREALNTLRQLFAMITTPNQTMSIKSLIYSWPVQVPQRYLVLMSEREPRALVILAHYCIMLNMIDSFWFMEGCASRVLHECTEDLDEEWLHYLQWPVSVVHHTPIVNTPVGE